MHILAIILIAAAGGGYCAAALMRWRMLGRQSAGAANYLWPLWTALVLHSASLALSLADGEHQDFTYGVLGVWAAVASLFFLGRFLAVPSKWLLVLPVGGMAILVAMAQIAGHAVSPGVPGPPRPQGVPAIVVLHIVFMATHMAATLVAGAAGGLYLLAVRQLKTAQPSAFKLPNLPLLERLSERSLVVAAALLIGGLATGGAAMQLDPHFSLLHPTALLALANMVLLTSVLGLRVANRLSRRGIACSAIGCLAITALSVVSLQVTAHG